MQDFRDLLKSGKIFTNLFANIGSLHFYHYTATVMQGRAMNLSQRRGGNRRRVEMRKELRYFDAKFCFDDAFDILVREWFDLVLKPGQRFTKRLGNEICPAGEELAELYKGRSKAFQIIGQFLGPGRAIGRRPGRFIESKAGPGAGGRIFRDQEGDIFVALEVMQ